MISGELIGWAGRATNADREQLNICRIGSIYLRWRLSHHATQHDPEVTDTDTDGPVREFSTRRTSLSGLETTRAPEARAQYPFG